MSSDPETQTTKGFPPLPKIVAIVAPARHGKDTFAEAVIQHWGFKRIALADAVKEEVQELFPNLPSARVEFDKYGRLSYPEEGTPEQKKIVRRLWQVWGTEARRAVFADYWIWQWQKKALDALEVQGFPGIIIPDIRFGNEFNFFTQMSHSLTVGIQRTTASGDLYQEEGIDYTHDSEVEIPDLLSRVDIRVDNTRDLEAYQRSIDEYVAVLPRYWEQKTRSEPGSIVFWRVL